MAGQSAGSRFRRAWVRPGYRPADVDAYIDRIEATLGGTAAPGQAVTAADVRAVQFRVTYRKGYDDRMVDDALDAYAARLASRRSPPPEAAF
jgi:DivIVA domain-containing protein